jgi:hypothetical protein
MIDVYLMPPNMPYIQPPQATPFSMPVVYDADYDIE